MNWSKAALLSIVFLISIVFSLLFTYLYGQFFQHDRYWKGTIERTQETEIDLISGFLSLDGVDVVLAENISQLPKMFDVVRGKLAITVQANNSTIYTNRIDRFSIQDVPKIISLDDSELSIIIDRYEPPSWQENFLSWFSQPNKWLTPRFDYITIPFAGLFLIFFTSFYAFIWRYRSAHLSKDVLSMLNRIAVSEE